MDNTIIGLRQIAGKTGAKLAMTVASAQSAVLTGGVYDITADVVCFISTGADPTAVVDTSYRLLASAHYRFRIPKDHKIAAIVPAGTGNLWFHEVG